MTRRHRLAAGLLLGLTVAACGGGTTTPTQPGVGDPTSPAATSAAVATEPAPPASDAPIATPGGVGAAADACGLLTPEEAAASLGTGPLSTTGGAVGPQTYCDYRTASGDSVLTTYMQRDAEQLWSVFESSLQTEPVSGIGDKAMFEPSTKLLLVLEGGTFFNVFVADLALTPAQALEAEKPLAEIMVGRA